MPHGKIGGTMAHTAECAAPEGSQDRDEWMTVIEMQEYMRASRNKAYDLIWSGEIDSYRLGRKLLVSRASGRLHRVEEREEMTAATAPGAARGRAREGASRRKELEDDHDYESESTPIPLTPFMPPSSSLLPSANLNLPRSETGRLPPAPLAADMRTGPLAARWLSAWNGYGATRHVR